MISGKTIICFASGWDYHPTSKHHVMRKLSRCNHIIWVNWHSSRRPRLHLADLKNIVTRLGQIREGPRRASDAITVLTPWQVPLPGSGLARQANRMLVRQAVGRVLGDLPAQPVQIWSFAPDVADMVGLFGEELVLYYCVDAFGEFAGYDRALIARRERELIARSDVVITTSPPLYEAKRRLHPNVHQLEHGVDHEHLSRALSDQVVVPDELHNLPRPILGFVGVVGDWVDVELIAGLARRRPQASVVIIGPQAAPKGPAANLPNVHWLGPRDHSLLPAYLKGFDVGLIPFRHVPLAHNANPIKLYEYLAAGVPTVSTVLPAVKPIAGSVWLADDAEATAAACDEAIRHNLPADRGARSRLMLAESWEQRLEQLSEIVEGDRGMRTSACGARRETCDTPNAACRAGAACPSCA